MSFTCFLLSSLLLIPGIPIINDWQLWYWQISFCFGLVPCIIHLSFQSYCAFVYCHEVLVIWCNLLSTWVAKLNEQFTCCIWHNSDVAVKIILVLQSKLLSLPYLCLPVLMRKTHNEETPPQAPSSHPFFLSCLFFLVLALCSCFWCCSTSPGLRQVPSESMSCVPFQCYFHFNTNTFSFTDCALSSLYLRFPLLPEEVNERNILKSVPSGSFPKAPGHSQSPTWISSGNSQDLEEERPLSYPATLWKAGE